MIKKNNLTTEAQRTRSSEREDFLKSTRRRPTNRLSRDNSIQQKFPVLTSVNSVSLW